ncbi:type II secretion system minor pseudopilin GspH [Parachitinimonas caeni]|uniref:Type II secretion system protein H n=1 Tax=Parachitinimonas caeni TaxID=3031301 RepID=A0ABT7E0L0_9NEIS|nr:type II secretion system minor pseudopilin GspH [Parachitinimonas caeni]MDK2125848.1 type II secretion system minor pseudopilin GspH [Parachitinimonas caeni]
MMPISAPGHFDPVTAPRRLPQLGFTLIEVMVVLVIITVVIALAAVKFGEPAEARLRREAERLSLLFESARDEAIASGAQLAWEPQKLGYRFVKRDEQAQWVAISDNDSLRQRDLADGQHFGELRVNRQPLAPGGRLLFSPSGVNDPFTVVLLDEERRVQLDADAMGRLSIGSVEALQRAP